MKHDVFISYRRDGGEALAQLLRDKLTERGYRVFYDIESLKSGPFDTKLLRKIEECEDVLLILPPQALDRCIYDEDWVRQEIRHAIKHKKNIIPIMMRGFSFPRSMPQDIQLVSSMHGVSFETMEYLEARVDKIVAMLCSRGKNAPSESQGYVFISYSTKNQASADAMRAFLQKNGVRVWMAPGDIPVGSKYAQVISRAIKECACAVLMLTDDAQNSVWVAKEIERAVNYRKPILPVRLENLVLNDEFELYISTDQIIALKKIDERSEELQHLLKSVRTLVK